MCKNEQANYQLSMKEKACTHTHNYYNYNYTDKKFKCRAHSIEQRKTLEVHVIICIDTTYVCHHGNQSYRSILKVIDVHIHRRCGIII